MSSGLPVELETFRERVHWLVQTIPEGKVATYGQIATLAGSPAAARAVGNVLKSSGADGVDLPWWRVINAQGRISLKSDVQRPKLQRRLLEAEGVQFDASDRIDLQATRWDDGFEYWMTA